MAAARIIFTRDANPQKGKWYLWGIEITSDAVTNLLEVYKEHKFNMFTTQQLIEWSTSKEAKALAKDSPKDATKQFLVLAATGERLGSTDEEKAIAFGLLTDSFIKGYSDALKSSTKKNKTQLAVFTYREALRLNPKATPQLNFEHAMTHLLQANNECVANLSDEEIKLLMDVDSLNKLFKQKTMSTPKAAAAAALPASQSNISIATTDTASSSFSQDLSASSSFRETTPSPKQVSRSSSTDELDTIDENDRIDFVSSMMSPTEPALIASSVTYTSTLASATSPKTLSSPTPTIQSPVAASQAAASLAAESKDAQEEVEQPAPLKSAVSEASPKAIAKFDKSQPLVKSSSNKWIVFGNEVEGDEQVAFAAIDNTADINNKEKAKALLLLADHCQKQNATLCFTYTTQAFSLDKDLTVTAANNPLAQLLKKHPLALPTILKNPQLAGFNSLDSIYQGIANTIMTKYSGDLHRPFVTLPKLFSEIQNSSKDKPETPKADDASSSASKPGNLDLTVKHINGFLTAEADFHNNCGLAYDYLVNHSAHKNDKELLEFLEIYKELRHNPYEDLVVTKDNYKESLQVIAKIFTDTHLSILEQILQATIGMSIVNSRKSIQEDETTLKAPGDKSGSAGQTISSLLQAPYRHSYRYQLQFKDLARHIPDKETQKTFKILTDQAEAFGLQVNEQQRLVENADLLLKDNTELLSLQQKQSLSHTFSLKQAQCLRFYNIRYPDYRTKAKQEPMETRLENTKLKSQLDTACSELKASKETVLTHQTNLATLQTKATSLEQTLAEKTEALNQQETLLRNIQLENTNLENANTHLAENLNLASERIFHVEEQLKRSITNVMQRDQVIYEHTETIENLKSKLDEQTVFVENVATEKEQQLAEKNYAIETLQHECHHLKQQIDKLQTVQHDAEVCAINANAAAEGYQKEYEQSQDQIKELQKKLTSVEDSEALNVQAIKEFVDKNEKLEKANTELSAENSRLKAELESIKAHRAAPSATANAGSSVSFSLVPGYVAIEQSEAKEEKSQPKDEKFDLKQSLHYLLNKLVSHQFELGLFGGETVTIRDVGKITVPKGVKEIILALSKFLTSKDATYTGEQVVQEIKKTGSDRNNASGFFGKRQKSTIAVYGHFATLNKADLENKDKYKEAIDTIFRPAIKS